MEATAERRKRVVVIGAGIVGVCVALSLRREGFSVTLVDRRLRGGSRRSLVRGVAEHAHAGRVRGGPGAADGQVVVGSHDIRERRSRHQGSRQHDQCGDGE